MSIFNKPAIDFIQQFEKFKNNGLLIDNEEDFLKIYSFIKEKVEIAQKH